VTALQVSFLVPLFNHVVQTVEMLRSLEASLPHELTYEVIFADDGSTDGTRNWLAGLDDARVQFILNDRNYGYAITNNLAIKQAKGRYLGLLNNDLLFEPGWFEPMLAALNTTSLNAGVVGNVQHRVADKSLDHAGVALMPSGKFEHIADTLNTHTLLTPVYAVTGACMLMHRSDFEAVGGFDEVFVNGCEDIDLCLKVRQAGKQIYVAPDSQIFHHVSLSRSRVSLQNEKNSQYLYSKWRKEIKLELTKCWVDLLGQPEGGFTSYIDGTLTSSFKSKPHIAAMSIAEAALLREEARWSRDLGTVAPSADWLSHISVSGVKEVPQLKTYLAEAEVVVSIDHIKTARNFYVCARLLDDFDPASIAIDLTINGAQKKTFRLHDGHVVNVGVIDPLIFPNSKNELKAEVYFVDANWLAVKPAPHVMLISHFVIDDEVVKPDL
jgi:GT2 family glycosyltransferase